MTTRFRGGKMDSGLFAGVALFLETLGVEETVVIAIAVAVALDGVDHEA
jgi:hypothetical protein